MKPIELNDNLDFSTQVSLKSCLAMVGCVPSCNKSFYNNVRLSALMGHCVVYRINGNVEDIPTHVLLCSTGGESCFLLHSGFASKDIVLFSAPRNKTIPSVLVSTLLHNIVVKSS